MMRDRFRMMITRGSTMTRLPGIRWVGVAGALLAIVTLLGVSMSDSIVSARATTIGGGTWNFTADGVAKIKLTGAPSQGVGAADISVAFDSAVLKITACDTGDLSGACNPNAPGGPARAAGFKAPAATSDAVIATLSFDCVGTSGSSALTITVNELLDGTPGEAAAITATIQNGVVTCSAPGLPETGSAPGDSSGGSGWVVPLVVSLVAAVFGLGAFGAWRMRRRV